MLIIITVNMKMEKCITTLSCIPKMLGGVGVRGGGNWCMSQDGNSIKVHPIFCMLRYCHLIHVVGSVEWAQC